MAVSAPATLAQCPTTPVLCGSPRLDQYVTSTRPLLSWPNSSGGTGPRTYVVQVDTTPSFDSPALIQERSVAEGVYATAWRVSPNHPLKDRARYYWRVMAEDAPGKASAWGCEVGGAVARFPVDTSWNDGFVGRRARPVTITASDGSGVDRIQDYNESGATYWEGSLGRESHWITFDLGRPVAIGRIWLLCGMAGWAPRESKLWTFLEDQESLDGRLVDYEWQSSDDGDSWRPVPGGSVRGGDGFKMEFVLDAAPVRARYFRLVVTGWMGPAPRVHEVTLYTPGEPTVPDVPDADYVLVIGNYQSDERNRNTAFRDLVLGLNGHIRLPWKLGVVEAPHYHASLSLLRRLPRRPVAIFLTGFGRWGEMLPQFEYNGVYEIIREANVPIFGVCGGLQLLAQQEDFTFARDTGRTYSTGSVESLVNEDIPPIQVVRHDSIFDGLVTPFYGAEYHSWAVDVLPERFEVLATSRDSHGCTCIEVVKDRDRLVYGVQFHPEIPHPWNTSKVLVLNFLRMVLSGAQ